MTIADLFKRITTALDRSGIPYMLTGSFASAFYGAPRTTQDIDFVIAPSREQLQIFVHSLPASEYYADLAAALEAHTRQSLFNVVDLATGWKLDFIIRKTRAFSLEEFRRRVPIKMQGVDVFIASPEDAILSKLEWAKLAESRRQIEDAVSILKIRSNSLDHAYMERWIAELDVTKEWESARRSSNPNEQ